VESLENELFLERPLVVSATRQSSLSDYFFAEAGSGKAAARILAKGRPFVVAGTLLIFVISSTIPLLALWAGIAEGDTFEQLIEAYPQLTGDDIKAALKFAAVSNANFILLHRDGQ
jgi:hypothetical protein